MRPSADTTNDAAIIARMAKMQIPLPLQPPKETDQTPAETIAAAEKEVSRLQSFIERLRGLRK